jgi:hypothetical protein
MGEIDFFDFPELEKIIYTAVYDPDTLIIKSVGPSTAFKNEKYKIVIDDDLAEGIISGSIKIHHCFADLHSRSIDIVEKHQVRKIDDILHRIIEKKWSSIIDPEIYVLCETKKNQIKIQMTTEYGGTKKSSISVKRRCSWSGDTVMDFYITEYNDPNILLGKFSTTVDELVSKTKTVGVANFPKKFSIYTRRIFKNYMVEIK